MRPLIRALPALLALACADEDDDAPPVDTDPDTLDITLTFRAEVGTEAFSCGRDFTNLGAVPSGSARFRDLRMLVLNAGLLDDQGSLAPLELTPDARQAGNLGLLDFEDGTVHCAGFGTPEVYTTLTGVVPFADYRGVAFTLGVPFEMNHKAPDGSSAVALQAAEGLFTGPLLGFDFFRLDLETTGEPDGYPIRVHSNGCLTDPIGQVTSCTQPNHVTLTLPTFDPAAEDIVLDLAELLVRNNVNRNASVGASETTPGCQSDATDPDCQDFFVAYGMTALPPTWVRAEPK